MSCVWRGELCSVTWPHHDPLSVDLRIELWWSNESQCTTQPRLEDADMHFDKFVRIRDVPLWAICGPEMSVMTRNPTCQAFFTEFAAIDKVAMRISVNSRANAMFSHILVFSVLEGTSRKIAARPLNINVETPKRVEAEQISRPSATAAAANLGTLPKTPVIDIPLPDVKKSLQQTILGALRLRGIRGGSPEFKKTYFSVLYLAEVALQKLETANIGLHTIHDKVEAILSVID